MAAAPNPANEQPEFPAPLEFFTQDFIHPDNQEEIDREQRRWRVLGFRERIKLQWYADSLARQLRKAQFHSKMTKFIRLKKQFEAAKEAYQTGVFTDEGRLAARERLEHLIIDGALLRGELDDLRPLFLQWQHYAGWLDYERQHRRDLILEEKRERRIRSDMRKESGWIERIIYDVWRKTDGCHHTYKAKDKSGKEKTKTPKFERCVIKPDAHWFYLRTRMQIPLLGFRWRLPDGVTTTRLQEDDVLENLRAATGRQVDALWTDQNQFIIRVSRLDSPDALPRNVQWSDAMKFYPEDRRLKFPYTIGVTEGRKFYWLDLTSDTNILIAGTQGSGKSNLVNGIIGAFVSTHTPSELRIVAIDLKGGMEFTFWEELPHLLWEMAKTIDEVKPILTLLVSIMRQRMELLRTVKAKDILSYNARVDEEHRLERIVVVIDEMANFVGLHELTEELHNLIFLIVSQARAVGISMILCTQHPEVKVLPGRIKTNIPVRLCGYMPTISASQIVLDTPEAARLPKMAGRFACKRGMDQMVIQCPEIPDDEIRGIVSSALQAYPDVPNDLRQLGNQPAIEVWNEARIIKAALEWTEGQLSGKKLNSLLKDDSPGERHLSKLARSIVDLWTVNGGKTFKVNEIEYRIKQKGKAYYISEVELVGDDNDDNDKNDVIATEEETSPSPSSSPAPEAVPVFEAP